MATRRYAVSQECEIRVARFVLLLWSGAGRSTETETTSLKPDYRGEIGQRLAEPGNLGSKTLASVLQGCRDGRFGAGLLRLDIVGERRTCASAPEKKKLLISRLLPNLRLPSYFQEL